MASQNSSIVLNSCVNIPLSIISSDVGNEIKQSLTFSNPKYEQALKYSRRGNNIRINPYITYYSVSKGFLKVPYGIFEMFDIDAPVKDMRVFPSVSVPKFSLDLRKDQELAASGYIDSNSSYRLSGVIQMPTGKGKSILGLYLASYYKTKTLVIVHKDDLVKGWSEDIKYSFEGKVTPGIIKAKSRTVGDFITIATIQTLNNLDSDFLHRLYNEFGLVILDECHHCPASSFQLVNNFNSRYKLGLSATPERSDGLTHVISLYFGGFAFKYSDYHDDEEDLKESDILPVSVKVVDLPVKFNPSCYKTKTGSWKVSDFSPATLKEGEKYFSDLSYSSRPNISFQSVDKAVTSVSIPLVSPYVKKEYDLGHSCIVFFLQKESILQMRDQLIKVGVPSEDIGLYYGNNSDKENNLVLDKARSRRKFITLTTYAKATEGTNVRQWEVEFLVSSINNPKNVEQAVGRVRRTGIDKLSTALVYDFRFPHSLFLSKHGVSRDSRYKKLGFSIEKDSPKSRSFFKRGF